MTDQKKDKIELKTVLLEKDKTNIPLAEQLMVSIIAVSKWCISSNQPTVETLFQISEILNVEVCELLVTNRQQLIH
jgi:putative transcriptional regulator